MKEETQKPVYGQIKEGYFLRQSIGDGETESGTKFELACSISTGAPIVLVGKRAFFLTWDEIVNLANAAGLFDEVAE